MCVRVFTAETELEYTDRDGPVVCWDRLGLPDLDCDQKPVWISSSSLAGELIQPGPQEVWTKWAGAECPTVGGAYRNQADEKEHGRRKDGGLPVRDTAFYGDKDVNLLLDWAKTSSVDINYNWTGDRDVPHRQKLSHWRENP